jgi:hypothetical protein
MRNLSTLRIFLLIYTCQCFGQNKTTQEGLNIGLWTEEYELYSEKFKETGKYKIVDLNKYDTIRQLGENAYEIKYKGSTPLLFSSGKYNNKISVKDSIWQTLDSLEKLIKTELWSNGLNLWTKYFDEKNNLIEYDYDDFENDTSFYLTFKNNQLFKKAYYPPNDKNNKTYIFYPNNNLIISNAELNFYSRFGDEKANELKLNLSCKKNLSILSIKSSSNNIQVKLPSKSFPYRLNQNEITTIGLTYTPILFDLKEADTITIQTNEINIPAYKIYCSMRYTHIDGKNVETIGHLSLSKTKDKYLFISSMGTVTNAYLKNKEGEKTEYEIHGNTKIGLEKLQIGEYDLSIFSCDTGGFIKLKITE